MKTRKVLFNAHRATLRPSAVLTLALLAFVAGMVAARLVWPAAQTAPVTEPTGIAPSAPMPVPPTLTPFPTPTPTSPDVGDALETLYIDIAPGDFALIEAKREEALAQWILLASDADFVPGTLRWRDTTLPVELRLKGDWADHFAHDKWSFRIRTQGDQYLWGMRVFSLQDPSTRTYLNEWLFLENLRREGVMAVSYRFVRVVLNGGYKGIYALEEGFAKELIESQQRREGVIVRYNEDLLWEYWAEYENDLVTPRGVMDFHLIDDFESGRIDLSPVLSAQRDAAIGGLRALWRKSRTASEVLDVETYARFLALSDLWSAEHALVWHNLRFYYNPVTTRLEPVVFDAQPLGENPLVELLRLKGLRETGAYGDLALQEAYLRYLRVYSQPAYLEELQQQFGAELEVLRATLMPEFGESRMADGREALALPWDLLVQRQASLRELLSPLQMVYAYVPSDAPTSTLTLNVGNLLDFPVEVVAVQRDGVQVPVDHTWSVGDASDNQPVAVANGALVLPALPLDATFIPYTQVHFADTVGSTEPGLQLVTRIWGMTQTVTQPVLPAYPPPVADGALPALPTLDTVLVQHSFLHTAESDSMLTMSPGVWTVVGDLVLPEGYGLRLEAGTELRFAPDAFLLATGPLVFDGTEAAPVILGPTGESWRGVVVLEALSPSYWRYTTVQATDAISRAGWTLTGGITFYRSPIRLDHCRILGTLAEDGLNVIGARFEFVDSEFASTRSDAFDADFGQGLIERCVFHDIGADAIDVSGSDVQVRDVRMVNLGDKGLSVGETSRLIGIGLSIENADFGVVSKDLSQVTISDVTVTDVRIAGFAAYVKKPSYGPASIIADRVVFHDIPVEQQTLVQTGSWIDLDGVRIWGTDIDVEGLYEKWQR